MTTERLTLRALEGGDAPRIAECCARREISIMTRSFPHPYPPEKGLEFVREARAKWERGEGFSFAVTLTQTGELVACAGVMPNYEHRNAELGYWIAIEHWGKGIATEASRPIVDFAFERLGLHRVYASYFAFNPASRRVLEKLGFRHEGTLRGHAYRFGDMVDVEYVGMLRTEWEQLRSGARPK